ncbi:MAG: Flagellin [Devosia sp.]|nr:Flagellin [Devosia sp.]
MADITLSKAVRSNLLNLQSTANQMGKTQERLATGLKVNSALDNPTNFFTASALSSRSSDLGRLLDNVSNAVQTIAAADKGISAITKLVEAAQSTARQALQSAAPSFTLDGTAIAADTRAADTATSALAVGDNATAITISDGTNSITATYTTAAGNGTTTFSNSSELDTLLRDNDVNVTATGGATLTLTSTVDDGSFTATGALATAKGLNVPATVRATNADLAASVAANYTLSFTAGGRTETITFGTGAGQVQNLDDLENELGDLEGVSAKVVDGAISVTTKGGNPFTVATSNAAVNTAVNLTSATYEPTEGDSKRSELVGQYNDVLKQIDQLAKDSGFNGVNLLNGDDLQVTFNEDGTSKLDVKGTTFNASGLGLNEISDDQTWNTNAGINTTLDGLKAATEDLRTQASKFGSNLSVVETRQDFTKNMINVLETGAANLTLADTNEEAANLLALQTRQQLSSTALSLASQADQNVLRLF